MPELPEAAGYIDQSGECYPDLMGSVYTADQMRAYATQALLKALAVHQDAELAARALAARAQPGTMQWCKKCGEGVTPGLCRRADLHATAPQDALRRDAARYRWLLDNARNISDGDDGVCLVVPTIYSEDWDEKCGEAIDKAMQADSARAQLGGSGS
jgi:hypothetical protein